MRLGYSFETIEYYETYVQCWVTQSENCVVRIDNRHVHFSIESETKKISRKCVTNTKEKNKLIVKSNFYK